MCLHQTLKIVLLITKGYEYPVVGPFRITEKKDPSSLKWPFGGQVSQSPRSSFFWSSCQTLFHLFVSKIQRVFSVII